MLLYGDAVAHINIARRVFDSRTPGLLQLGTVWLPLPHLLMVPFLVSRNLWQTGIGGSIPSLFAYVLSVLGIFRLVQIVTAADAADAKTGARFAAWLATLIFAVNPNLIYLQTTAMTELLYLPFFVWATAFFSRGLRRCTNGEPLRGNSDLVKSGLCLLGATLTRYDGWLLAAVIALLALVLSFINNFAPLRRGVLKLVLLAAIGPVLWLAYNAAVYQNPLEFANGPYSAKAIELKTSLPGTPPHPGTHNLPVAFAYFFKAGELNLAPGVLQLSWVAALLLGTAIILLFQRRFWPLLLLWTPVPFYMISIAYGGVPIFVPTWWPHSLYNLRYGIEMLPAFAVLTAVAAHALIRFVASTKAQVTIAAVFIAFIVISYVQVVRAGPVSFQEAVINSRTRIALEKQLASIFATFPQNSTFLMYLGDHVGAFERAGIPLSHVINEGNHRPWKRPADPEGLWERALAHPAPFADYVIAFDHDLVATEVNKAELQSLLVLHVTGQPEAIIYRTLKSNQTR